MQAIETHYAGYAFRSRLEARWAVLFDTLGLEFEYEPEGFVLPSGTRYLPDFYLPGLGVWAEVKGHFTPQAEVKTAEFVASALTAAPGSTVAILTNIFRQPKHGLKLPLAYRQQFRLDGNPIGAFAWCPVCAGVEEQAPRALLDQGAPQLELEKSYTQEPFCGCSGLFRYACVRAQQARFEFGEAPR